MRELINALRSIPLPTEVEFCEPSSLPEKIPATISFPNGTTQRINTSIDTSFGTIRQFCADKIQETPENTLLCVGKYFLEDEDTWGAFGSYINPSSPLTALPENTIIHCFKQFCFNISLKFNGRLYQPLVTLNTLVEDIINYIQLKTLNNSRISFSLDGKLLDPDATIYSLQVKVHSIFHVRSE